QTQDNHRRHRSGSDSGNVELGCGLGDDFVDSDAVRQLHQLETLIGDVQYAQIGDDAIHHTYTGERQRALRQQLEVFGAVLLARDVIHQHDDAADARNEVHRTAHALDHLAGNHPVGEIALFRDLHGPQDGKVDLAAADHAEGVRRGEDGRARQGRDRLLTRVDQVGIDLIFRGERTNAQQTVLGLQPNLDTGRSEEHTSEL